MLTFKDLYMSTKKFAKAMKSYARDSVDVDGKLVDIIPNRIANLITFRFRVKSVRKANEGYNVVLQFYNVKFSDKPESSNSAKIIEKDTGKPLYFEKISLTDNRKQNYVRVRCSCMDFRHRFSWEDKAYNALYGGRPARYTRKPGSNRPPVNKYGYPGMCKHIFQCAKSIEYYFTR